MISALVIAALLGATAPSDTVYTLDGGRITGSVLEESPTSGVTIQTLDGTVRRIERSQILRVEYADGTVSSPRPPEVAPPARAAGAEGPVDTVFLTGGGRVRGTVLEENATTGAKLRRLDGTIQIYAPGDFARIEYADGTVSTPRPAPVPAAEPAPAPRPSIAPGAVDTVYFVGGGRVRGTVIEENPKTGVKVRLLDGTYRVYSRDELMAIEYSDGTVSRRKTAAPAPTPATPTAPAAAPPPPREEPKRQPYPIYLAVGLGATFLDGDLEEGASFGSQLESEQAHFSGEVGLRFSPSFALGVYGDMGAGDPASATRDQCRIEGIDCVGMTGRFGILARHTWAPLSSRPKWLSLGTGWEFASVTVDPNHGGNETELFRYNGPEYLRLGAGIDFRSNPVLGIGLYGSVAVGEYDEYEDPTGTRSVAHATHTTAQVGVRLILFP